MQIFDREIYRCLQGLTCVFDVVMLFKIWLEPIEDLDRVFWARLVNINFLKAPHHGPVFFKIIAEFFICG